MADGLLFAERLLYPQSDAYAAAIRQDISLLSEAERLSITSEEYLRFRASPRKP